MSARLPPADERERNMQFWDLWTPEEKEAQKERERLRDSWCPKRVAVELPGKMGSQAEAEFRHLLDEEGHCS